MSKTYKKDSSVTKNTIRNKEKGNSGSYDPRPHKQRTKRAVNQRLMDFEDWELEDDFFEEEKKEKEEEEDLTSYSESFSDITNNVTEKYKNVFQKLANNK